MSDGNFITRWPRLMKLKTAAEYCDMSESFFTEQVKTGRMPRPVIENGRTKRFDRQALDRAIDSMAAPSNVVAMGDRRL